MPKQIFVNLPVKDLQKSMTFFTELGFSFNMQFTDEKAACLVIGDNIFAMLITENYFRTFTTRGITDATQSKEVLIALSADSREEVDEIAAKAENAGGKVVHTKDHGWMYYKALEDLDGHHWEFAYMDMTAFNETPPQHVAE